MKSVETMAMDVEAIAQETDRATWVVAEGLVRLMEKGRVQSTAGTVDEAIADLRARYPRPSRSI